MILLTNKEMEALLFVMDEEALLTKLTAKRGLTREQTKKVVDRLKPWFEGRMMPRELGEDGRIVVAVCIEDSDWPLAYAENRPQELQQALAVLRDLAKKVVLLGVEITRIAHA